MASDSYRDLIQEAFIKPLRSVLIVDDDYPTYEEILADTELLSGGRSVDQPSEAVSESKKAWRRERNKVLSVIEDLRRHTPPLLIDIHDGQSEMGDPAEGRTQRLHQSDLLILDYQLDKSKPDGGEKAIEILRDLMQNERFNLVIVHTGREISHVFYDVLWGLIKPGSFELDQDHRKQMENEIDNEENKEDRFSESIRATVTDREYFHYRLRVDKDVCLRDMVKGKIFDKTLAQDFREICDRVAARAKDDSEEDAARWKTTEFRRKMLLYLLDIHEKDNKQKLNNRGSYSMRWSEGEEKRWIWSESVFVAFTQKSETGSEHEGRFADLLEGLCRALYDWKPDPSKLLLTMHRVMVDRDGTRLEQPALGEGGSLALWYRELLESSEDDRHLLVRNVVQEHLERLTDEILEPLESFAMKMIELHRSNQSNLEEEIKTWFGIDLNDKNTMDKAKLQYNRRICSKPPTGSHLMNGHVFRIEGNYWVCLSPACDLEPGQQRKGHLHTYGEGRIPFLAVKLIDKGKKYPSKRNINSNQCVFLSVDSEDDVTVFSFTEYENSAPEWHTFFAENSGRFCDDRSFFLSQVKKNSAGNLEVVRESVRVVAQLRAEYALNLVQKLGISLTRIGLDFQ